MNDDANEQFEECVEWANGDKYWFLHGKLHREDGAAIECADGHKEWWLHGKHYDDANAWAKDVLKLRNESCDDAAIESFLRLILVQNQNDLI
jgi:hypothetical protein